MRHARPSTSVLWISAVLAPLLLCQCKTAPRSYKDVSYDPAKLKTPAGHGLQRMDYPFDEQGNYRKDWVKNNSSGLDRSASPEAPAAPAPETEVAAAASSAPTGYPTYAEASAARQSGAASIAPSTGNPVQFAGSETAAGDSAAAPVVLAAAGSMPAAAAAPVSASYHKVSSGDTLFSLANRYNTSVADLKRVNGLSGDSIRAGQSLRLP